MNKPFSQACENNKAPILAKLAPLFAKTTEILELASGTGQHAAHFAARLPHARWQTSDLIDNHGAIQTWIDDAKCDNLMPPVALDVRQQPWPVGRFGGIFCANAIHIMAWSSVQSLFDELPQHLNQGACVCFYGPYNYAGQYTSDSNRQFDQWLQQRDPDSGIRDFEAVQQLATQAGLSLHNDHAMPANNRLLVWRFEC